MDGFKELLKEPAFKIEVLSFLVAVAVLFVLPYPLWAKLFMFSSLLVPLIAEALNTAIEKTVDLMTTEYHVLAKHAKDIAAFGVLISIGIPIFVWLGFILYFEARL